jgi:hypothetical protein
MPLTADGQLLDQTPLSTQTTDVVQHAPPLYGEHILDQLYADVDQSGMMTPAPQSGMNTPFYNQSRAGSHENLASLNHEAPHPNGAVPPAALSNRLQNLNMTSRNNSYRRVHASSGTNTPHLAPQTDGPEGYFDHHGHSAPNSNPLSRRTSEENDHGASTLTSGQHTPEHIDYSELGDLTKVPSYRTAVKTPARGMNYSDALPNYEAAVSAPQSPVRTFSSSTTPGSEDGVNGHMNGNGGRRSMIGNPLASMGFTPIHAPAPAHVVPSHVGEGDERRRLHILQTRGRAH